MSNWAKTKAQMDQTGREPTRTGPAGFTPLHRSVSDGFPSEEPPVGWFQLGAKTEPALSSMFQ